MASAAELIDGEPVCVAAGFQGCEGPVWMGSYLLFSDIPSNRIVRWEMRPEGPWVTTYRWPSGRVNGNTLDRQGRLISCEYTGRGVTRTEPDGTITMLADRYDSRRLSSPNDVVVKSDGAVYFTDPPAGLRFSGDPREQEVNGVYRLSPDAKTLTRVVDDFETPNGLCFSPDETLLYINDSRKRQLWVFDVNEDGTLQNGRLFAEPSGEQRGVPDGMKMDTEGRLYTTGPGGIWIFAPDGTHVGTIETPEPPRNLAWGDPDWKTLYLTMLTSLYRVRMKTQGIALI